MNETDTQLSTERQFTLIEWQQREADFTAMIATKDELLAIQAKRMIDTQTTLEQALSVSADPVTLKAEQAKLKMLEEQLKAIQATAAQSDADRTAAIEQLKTIADDAED
jgi:elongation factor P--beta-lysine ligase